MNTIKNYSKGFIKISCILWLINLCFCHNMLSQSCIGKTKAAEKPIENNLVYDAAKNGDLQFIKKAVFEKGYDVNTLLKSPTSGQKMGIIHIVSYHNHPEILKFILDHGADADIASSRGNTALNNAAIRGNLNIADILIKHGADINKNGAFGYTPLHHACLNQRIKIVQLLLKNKANINGVDNDEQPPIIHSSWNGNPDILNLLLSAGADVNSCSKSKQYVIHNLAIGGYDKAVNVALNNGANPNVVNEDGKLPLHYAVVRKNIKIIKLLIPKTKNLDTREYTIGNTALHAAALNGDVKATKSLLDAGANSNIYNNSNKKPIDYAIQYGFTELVNYYQSEDLAIKDDYILAEKNRMANLQPVNNGQSKVIYCGHSGWIVITQKKVLVFDYWSNGEPDQPGLVNGSFNSKEINNKEIYVFVSHDHSDHYDTAIYKWANKVNNINYVYGFNPLKSRIHRKNGYQGPEYTHIEDNHSKKIKDIRITTLKSNDSGQGFLIETEGISIYHPGDHAWFSPEDEEIFKKEIDFIAQKNSSVDIAFLPVTGCPSRWQKEYIVKGFFYNIDKLNPKQVFPMHAFRREYLLKEFAEMAKERKNSAHFFCAENRGDNYLYENNPN